MQKKFKIIKKFKSIAKFIEDKREEFLTILSEYETYKTAEKELNKTIKALNEYNKEITSGEKRTPMGKIAIFLPYNMPLYSLVLYSFGCLLGENSVFIRPSSVSKKITTEIFNKIQHFNELKIHLCNGEGSEFIRKINEENFDAVIFTGKWESVKRIESQININKTKLIYCGSGMCPLVIREDADLDLASSIAIESKVFNTSQDCLCYENIFVQEKRIDEFYDLLISKLRDCVIGDNSSKLTDFGTTPSSKFVNHIKLILSKSKGKKIYGNEPCENRINPMVVEIKEDDILAKSEKFAPIFTIIKYSSDEEVCKFINAQEYALGIGVCGKEFPLGTFPNHTIIVNNQTLFASEDAHVAFGGRKKSGFVKFGKEFKDGPILFFEETTKCITREQC